MTRLGKLLLSKHNDLCHSYGEYINFQHLCSWIGIAHCRFIDIVYGEARPDEEEVNRLAAFFGREVYDTLESEQS